jgi:hypothetical protein
MKKLFFATMAITLFFSCEKSLTSELDLDQKMKAEITTPLFNDQIEAMGSGTNSGAEVIRYDGEWGFRFIDDETGNYAWVNIKFEELCFGDRQRDIIDIQDVLINEKDGTDRNITLWKGKDIDVNVYEYAYPTCGEYINATPIYSGVGDFVWTDNDFVNSFEGEEYDTDNKNKNSYGFRLHGDGISIIFKATYDGENVKSKTKIMIK